AKIILNDGTEIKSFVVVVVAAKVVELDLGTYGLNTATASKIPFTQQVEGTKILSATFAGVKIGLDAITFENGIVTIPYEIVSKLYGKNRTATISTDVVDYYYTLDVVTCLITSVNQIHTGSTSVLPQYAIAGGATAYDNKSNNGKDASANNIYGYFVLGADIDFGGISIVHAQTNWDAGTGFAGTLDGRGYTISNFTLNGHNALFGGMSSSAVISNLNIVDFSVYQGGLFGWYFNGSYDNLFIKSNADSTDYILGNKPSGANVFTNCVVVSQGSVSFSLDGEMNETFGSVFYVEDPYIVGVELKSTCKVESISIVKEVNANEDVVLEISGVNRIIYRGVDVSNQEGIILDSDTITFSAEYISTHRSTFTLDMGKFNRYFLAKLESEEIVVNNVIAAASRTNDENQVIETDFVYEIDGAVESVTISGNAVSYSVSDGYLYISSSVLKENVGKHVITIKTNANTYVLNTTIATFVATKFSDISSCLNASGTLAPAMIALGATSANFKESAANAKGYIVLANDIDAQGQIFNFGFYGYNSLTGNGTNPYYGFNGTFDGNGKSIYNFVTGSEGWQTVFGMSTSTREFKDLTLIGSVPSGQYFEGLFGYMVSGNLNNVYIDIELGSACTYGIFGRMTGGFNVTDSTIIVREGTKALSGAALSQQIASATNGALWNKGTTFNSTIVLTDYAFTTALKSKIGEENIYSITDNQIEAGCTLDGEVFVELSGITKIFKNGKNITSKVIVSENGAILTFDEVQKGEELVVIGSGFAKIVKVANTAAYVSANFNGNGATSGSVEKITVKTGDSITLPENTFERVGYTFVGWSLTMSGEEILNAGDSIVLGQTNSTIYAIWTANENTINFNGNGADSGSMQSIVARTNENIILPANAFTKQWHGFIGWSLTANGEVEYTDKSIYVVGVESEITLYAVWEFLLVEKEINIGNYGLNTATETSRNLIIQGIEQQPLSFVFSYKNETKTVSYTYDSVAKTITIPYSEISTFIGPNAFQIEMYTDSVIYIVNGVLATLEISQASQINTGSTSSLNQMQKIGGATGTSSSGLNYSGYYYLSNDIDFGGSTISHAREYYRWSLFGTYGTYGAVIKLDGNGFTFKNFVINGTQFFDTLVSRNGEVSSIYNAGFIGTVSDDNGLFGKNVSASFDNCYFEISVASGKTNALTSTFASSMQGITNSIVIVKGAAGQTTTLGALSGDNIPATGSTIFIDSTSIVTAGGLLLDYTDNNIYVGSVDGQDVEIPLINPVKVFVGGKLINVQNTANGFMLPSEYSIRGTNVIVVGSNYAKIVTLSRPTEEYFDVVAYASYATELGDIVSKDFAIDIEGTIKSVTIEGESVSYELYDTFISIPSDVLKANTGKKLILVETDVKDYRVNATIADFGVSRASDISTFTGGVVTLSPVLRALGATSASFIESGANAKGYVALLNDIDFEGEAFTLGYSAYNSLGGNGNNPYYGFNGTFDGVGHSIKNFTFGGFSGWNTVFGVCSSTREFKDLTLIGTALSRYNEGLFGYFAMGNLTNCYFDITNAGTNYGVFGSAICGMKINNSTIIIRASEESDMTKPAIASSINKTTNAGTSLGRNMTVTNSTLITDFAVIDDIKNAFGAVYGLNSNLLEIEANRSNEIIINLSGITKIIKGGKDITAQASITETDAVLTTKVVESGETIIIIGSNFAKIATIVKQAIVIEDYVTWATQTDDSGEIVGNSLIYKVNGEVEMVTIDDEQVDYSQVGDSVVVSSKVLSTYVGNREIYISTSEEAYRIKAIIATFGITKLADVCAPTHVLAPWRVAGGATSNNFKEAGSASSGYIVLTKDLVGTGTEMFHDGTIGTSQYGGAGNNAAYGFTGTFDGCGYSITNVV
ncbi:MAG: InlB B-repeat-containing protein, partial [Clostridia bacterium]|nr:InlB B-repeat-containing protein [Clostridia bacterium]